MGQTLASATLRGVQDMTSQWAWRLPFALQWIWPVPLFIGCYFAPESPWNCVRRGKLDMAIDHLRRLGSRSETDEDMQAKLAYMIHTTNLERNESSGASFLEIFKGTDLRRTEINCVVWAAQILCGNALLGESKYADYLTAGFVILFLQAAGFTEKQSFNLNISMSVSYLVGGVVSWFREWLCCSI